MKSVIKNFLLLVIGISVLFLSRNIIWNSMDSSRPKSFFEEGIILLLGLLVLAGLPIRINLMLKRNKISKFAFYPALYLVLFSGMFVLNYYIVLQTKYISCEIKDVYTLNDDEVYMNVSIPNHGTKALIIPKDKSFKIDSVFIISTKGLFGFYAFKQDFRIKTSDSTNLKVKKSYQLSDKIRISIE